MAEEGQVHARATSTKDERLAYLAEVVRTASSYEDLAFHALTFVPARSAADFDRAVSLWDDAYHAYAASLDPALVAGFHEDAGVIAELARTSDHLATLQGLPRAFHDLDVFRATGRALFAEIDAREGVDETWLHALRCQPPALLEILRANMLLVTDRFAAAHAAHLDPEEARLVAAEATVLERAREVFDLDGVELVVSRPLGARGRGFGDTIYVGASAQGAGDGGLVALGLYERVVDTATEVLARESPDRVWHAAESTALAAYARLTEGTSLATHGSALVARFSAFTRDPSISPEDVERVVARLRR